MTEERSTHPEEPEKKPRPWPPTNRQALWSIGLVVALVTITLLVVNLYPDIWQDLSRERAMLIGIGVALAVVIVLLAIGGASLGWTGFADKTLWDLLQLLIVPLALVGIGLLFELQQAERQQALEIQTQALENRRAKAERELAEQRAQDAALQAYLDQMSTLLLNKDLRNSEGDSEVRTLARARTATVIQRLDAEGNRNVIRFLSEASLTGVGKSSISLLAGADLQGAHLEGVDLSTMDLSEADLTEANLTEVDLTEADLTRTNLRRANLSGANLTNASGLLKEWLEFGEEVSLEGATMPDGTLYEWYATREFEPALSFRHISHWELSLPETTDLVSIETEPIGGRLWFSHPRYALDPSRPIEEVPAPESADEWVSWFQRHPHLNTSEPVPVSVGDASGRRIDVTATSPPENFLWEAVPLYRTNEVTYFSQLSYKDRFVIVDVGGETVLINVSAPTGKFNEFLPKVQKVLDTVEWKGG